MNETNNIKNNIIKNNNIKNNVIDLTKIPELEKDEPIYKYRARLERYLIYYRFEKKKKILRFINNWYKMNDKNNKQIEFKDLRQFKNQYYHLMPSNEISKQYLIQNFEIYNREFTLELEYDDKLFTTYNVLYFIKLMLQKIDGILKREVIKKEVFKKEIIKKLENNKKIIYKKYTIWLKN
jgi:hypothetical protein